MSKMKDQYSIERRYVSNKSARPRLKNLGVQFLVAHETANNNADADAHYNYFQSITFEASAHTFIDDTKILEIIPPYEKAWHVQYKTPKDNQLYGDDANDIAIGIELCRTGDFNKAYDRYVWYHAYLCKKFGLNPKKDIVAHQTLDPSRRSDPQSWLEPNGISWAEFIADVYEYYLKWSPDSGQAPRPSKPPKPQGVRIVGTDLKGRRVENNYHANINYYDSPRWDNPSGTFKPGYGWVIDNKLLVNGSPMYRVKNSNGNIYYITAHPSFVSVKSDSTTAKPSDNTTIRVGEKVYLSKSADHYVTGEKIPQSKKDKIYTVQQVKSNKVLLKEIYSWVHKTHVSGKSNRPSSGMTKSFNIGQRVKIKSSATNYVTGERIPSRYKNKPYTIQQVDDDRLLLKQLYSWVYKSDVK
ncbi:MULTISPECIES: peptidoglycan recognition family protein [Clostridia]|uniref:peptidoglycan recognition protein family protein n=1 Tax=Clostridia TaxID=186801 RepID=UPI0018F51F43|nr:MULTISPECIES: peptidoglycan recognition family protein [Clostridia]